MSLSLRLRSAAPRLGIAALTVGLTAAPAHAGILLPSPIATTVGPGSSMATSTITAPNNYPSVSSANSVSMGTTFTGSGSVDSVFQGVNSGGITDYFFSVTTSDNTSAAFSSLAFQVGTRTGVNFTPLAGSPFFLVPPTPTSTDFSTIISQPTSLTFSGGSEAAHTSDTETFGFAVPDQPVTPFTFTLRETGGTSGASPAPEPSEWAAIAFTGLGLGGLLLRARKRRETIA